MALLAMNAPIAGRVATPCLRAPGPRAQCFPPRASWLLAALFFAPVSLSYSRRGGTDTCAPCWALAVVARIGNGTHCTTFGQRTWHLPISTKPIVSKEERYDMTTAQLNCSPCHRFIQDTSAHGTSPFKDSSTTKFTTIVHSTTEMATQLQQVSSKERINR